MFCILFVMGLLVYNLVWWLYKKYPCKIPLPIVLIKSVNKVLSMFDCFDFYFDCFDSYLDNKQKYKLLQIWRTTLRKNLKFANA